MRVRVEQQCGSRRDRPAGSTRSFECEIAGTKINAGGLVGAIGTMPMGWEASLKKTLAACKTLAQAQAQLSFVQAIAARNPVYPTACACNDKHIYQPPAVRELQKFQAAQP